jgi:uncharacterized protein
VRPWFNAKPAVGIHMTDIDGSAQSPCIGNCWLDDELTCLGCFRSLQEIKDWAIADDQRRCLILQNAEQRRAASQLPHDRSPPRSPI